MFRTPPPTPCFMAATPLHLRRSHLPIDRLPRRAASLSPNNLQLCRTHRYQPFFAVQPLDRPDRPSRPAKAGGSSSPPLIASHGLLLERKAVEDEARRGRTLRSRRWTTLGEVGVEGDWESSTRVEVAVAVQRVRRDYRVVGAVRAPVMRKCDRCAEMFAAQSRGKFEVWLATSESGVLGDVADVVGEDGVEAVEGFGMGVNEVDLTEHVRDAVWLGLPSKSLCKEECQGVEVNDGRFGTVTYAKEKTMELREEDGEEEERRIGDHKEAAEKLMELKKKLERQGL